MRLYNVLYPFEVDMDSGHSHVLYPTIKAALADAEVQYESRESEEESLDILDALSRQPASVTLDTVRKLDAATFCEILNSDGDSWCETSEAIGVIWWDGERKRAKFERGGVE